MNRPLNAYEIVSELGKRSRELDDITSELDQAERAAVNKREDYTRAYAQSFLCAEGAMDVRKQRALLDTSDERVAAELAETQVKALKRRIDTVRARIDVGRTQSAAVRAEVSLGGAGAP